MSAAATVSKLSSSKATLDISLEGGSVVTGQHGAEELAFNKKELPEGLV